jgi:hypothetical protein
MGVEAARAAMDMARFGDSPTAHIADGFLIGAYMMTDTARGALITDTRHTDGVGALASLVAFSDNYR